MRTKIMHPIGSKVNRLTILSESKFFQKQGDKCKRSHTLVKCDCGKEYYIQTGSLLRSKTKSCGCYNLETVKFKKRTHGKSYDKIYKKWQSMISRCYYDSHPSAIYYKAKGITVCDEWKHSFDSFYNWAINNGYPEKTIIDRIDNNKGYSPDNCRFVNAKESALNRTDTIIDNNSLIDISKLIANGNYDVKEISKKYGISKSYAYSLKYKLLKSQRQLLSEL